jgi:CRISPR-associated endonuclease/helicase Cas3
MAGQFASVFGWGAAGEVAGRLHDIGKTSAEYQAYIAQPPTDVATRGPDHSTAGAREVRNRYGASLGHMLAYAIAGHHAGLADGVKLLNRLDPAYEIKRYEGWEEYTGSLPKPTQLMPTRRLRPGAPKGFSAAFLTRMLFSCLVDADFLATESFYDKAENRTNQRGGFASLPELLVRLQAHMARISAGAPDTAVNRLRAQVLEHAVSKAGIDPGLFTMTVPTGGGKTLASLSFALEHAVRHGLRRVVYVIPFTSIIEQTAGVFRSALSSERDVLEHHASFDWEAASAADDTDDEGRNGLSKLKKAAENWDAPVVVTTAVQFFESLFASRTSRCRKLHNLAGSVIVLDEAQTLPIDMLLPCLAAIDELARNYNASVVLCTATQPALKQTDGFKFGLDIPSERELAPDPPALYRALKRVTVEYLTEPVADADVAARFADQSQMLCIVNSRAHARSLYEAIRHEPGAVHLTTLMCPRHRRSKLDEVRARLASGKPVRMVATSLIEAGVDVDFPEVWRASAGLDSIAQAAGRCNREGRRDTGRTVVFTPAAVKPPRGVAAFWQAARPVIRAHAEDLLGLDAINAYFKELYWQKGMEALDAREVEGRHGVLAAISERARDMTFPFRSIAEAFRLIDDVMAPVVVPYDADAKTLLAAISRADRPLSSHLRRLQQYVVGIPPGARDEWLLRRALVPAHPALGQELLVFTDLAHYREDTGVDLMDIGMRSPESNMF